MDKKRVFVLQIGLLVCVLFCMVAADARAGASNCADYGESCWIGCQCKSGLSCQPGSQRCYHKPRREGEPCVAGYPCGQGLSCEAGSQVCRAPGKLGDSCHATHPCEEGLSCQPGVQRCYHVSRMLQEPCSLGYECGGGLSCQPGVHKCYHVPRMQGEPCALGYECAFPLHCEAGAQICRGLSGLGEPCHATRYCGAGLSCKAFTQQCEKTSVNFPNALSSNAAALDKSAADTNEIYLFAYNLFLILPSLHMGSNPQRAEAIPRWIKNQTFPIDIAVFSEEWLHYGTVKDGMKNAGFDNYVYDDRGSTGSGLAIYSRYPIEKYDFMAFSGYCAAEDCLADKGVLYARINKKGKKYHVFGTHTNAKIEHHAWRRLQYGLINQFIAAQNIPSGEMILIAGDLNEDKIATRDKYDTMLADLNAGDLALTGSLYWHDAVENDLAPGNERQALDHILYSHASGDEAAPRDGSVCSYVKPKADYSNFTNRDLSDHYAMQCHIIGKEKASSFQIPKIGFRTRPLNLNIPLNQGGATVGEQPSGDERSTDAEETVSNDTEEETAPNDVVEEQGEVAERPKDTTVTVSDSSVPGDGVREEKPVEDDRPAIARAGLSSDEDSRALRDSGESKADSFSSGVFGCSLNVHAVPSMNSIIFLLGLYALLFVAVMKKR